jgi:hypothetical protein
MLNSVTVAPAGAIACSVSLTTCPSSKVQRALSVTLGAAPVLLTDA